MSTAYVNCNRQGFIEEKIYDLENDEDPEALIEAISKMNPQDIIDNEKQIIGKYPNTYTFSKSMAERVLKKKHGKLHVSIVRPSIIIASYQEPIQGWTDTLAAGGGITFACTSGLMHYVYSNPLNTVDLIPVDYTTNTILCCSAFAAVQKEPLVLVVHSSTSHLNPIRIDKFA